MRTSLMSVAGIVFRIEGSQITSCSAGVQLSFSILEGAHPRREIVNALAALFCVEATEEAVVKAYGPLKYRKVDAAERIEAQRQRHLAIEHEVEELVVGLDEEDYEQYASKQIKGNARLRKHLNELRKMNKQELYI